MDKSMTALVSAYSRAHHSKNAKIKVFDDCMAQKLISDEEYESISRNMADGIQYFDKSFTGSKYEALCWIVNNQLSPSPLCRSAFAESALETAVKLGANQYVILGAGYDTFMLRQPEWGRGLRIFEIDMPDTQNDKKARIARANIAIPDNAEFIASDLSKESLLDTLFTNEKFDKRKTVFVSALGLTYYVGKEDFSRVLEALGELCEGSAIAFDYPESNDNTQAELAKGAGENMVSSYSYDELEKLLYINGFLIFEHLTPDEIDERFFYTHNITEPTHKINAHKGVNLCLAVKKSLPDAN